LVSCFRNGGERRQNEYFRTENGFQISALGQGVIGSMTEIFLIVLNHGYQLKAAKPTIG